jgi:uncharacterized protein DUF6808
MMKTVFTFIKNNIKYLMSATIIILIALLCLSHCESNKNEKQMDGDRDNFSKRETAFKEIITKQNTKIYTQKQSLVKAGETIETQADIIQELKKVNTVVSMTVKTTIEKDTVLIDKPIYITKDGIEYLQVNAKFDKHTKWYSINGAIKSGGIIEIDSLTFITKPSIYIGYARKTLLQKITFQKAKREVVFKDDNPYSRVISMENIAVEEKKNRVSIGIQGGYGLTIFGFTPYLGIGIQYNLIKF